MGQLLVIGSEALVVVILVFLQFSGARSLDAGAAALDGGWRCRPEGRWHALVLVGLLGHEDDEESAKVLSRRGSAPALSISTLLASPWFCFPAPDLARMVLRLSEPRQCEAVGRFTAETLGWLCASYIGNDDVHRRSLKGLVRKPSPSLLHHPG